MITDESAGVATIAEITGGSRSGSASVVKLRISLSVGPLLLRSVEAALKKYSVSGSRLVRVISCTLPVVERVRIRPRSPEAISA